MEAWRNHDSGPRKVQSQEEILGLVSDYRSIELFPKNVLRSCPRNPPVHSRSPGGQAPKACRDSVDFNLFQGFGAICAALEHVI